MSIDAYIKQIIPSIAEDLGVTDRDAKEIVDRFLAGEHLGRLSHEWQIPATDLATSLVSHSIPLRASHRRVV